MRINLSASKGICQTYGNILFRVEYRKSCKECDVLFDDMWFARKIHSCFVRGTTCVYHQHAAHARIFKRATKRRLVCAV